VDSRLDVKLGFSCNNRCLFCVQGDKRTRYPDKTTDEIREILTEGRQGAEDVVFTGGEVTIRKDLPELVSHAKELGYRVIQIQTNGRMLSVSSALARLIKAGANEFSPAIHGPSAEVHDALTQAPGSFRQTVKGVQNVKKLGLPVILNSVICQANHRLLPEMAHLFVALEVDQFQLAFVHALGTAGENFDSVVPRFSEIMPFVHEALSIGRASGVRCMTEAIPLCFLGPDAGFAAEAIIPATRIVDAQREVPDYTRYRLEVGKAKGPPCAECSLDHVCEGPWREYPENLGWEEFRPVLAT
jgi:pyruvate-formate lyase-activating enzyme